MYLAFAWECEKIALSKMKDLALTVKPLECPEKHSELRDCDCLECALLGAHVNCHDFFSLVRKADQLGDQSFSPFFF